MNTKLHITILLSLILGLALVAFVGCAPKTTEDVTEETDEATEETVVVEMTETETPDLAGKDAIDPTADTAKTQTLEGLEFAHSTVGWNNEITVDVLDVVIADLVIVADDSTEEAEKSAIAKAKLNLAGAKDSLTGALTGTELSKADLNAVKTTINESYDSLKALWATGGGKTWSEAEGDKLKEGHKLEGDKLKEGEKERGDKLKEKYAEGEEEGN